jgi:hypothetical protein
VKLSTFLSFVRAEIVRRVRFERTEKERRFKKQYDIMKDIEEIKKDMLLSLNYYSFM